METVWDEAKRLSNLDKHKIDFVDVADEFDFADAFIAPAREDRYLAIGPFRQQIIAVVVRFYGTEAVSLISARPASNKERAAYAKIKN